MSQEMSIRTEVDLSSDDDDEDDVDEEYGHTVKKMRTGKQTNSNYKSGMKKIMEYFLNHKKYKSYVLPDEENPNTKFPFYLKIPVPLASLVACFGYYASKPVAKGRKRSRMRRKAKQKNKPLLIENGEEPLSTLVHDGGEGSQDFDSRAQNIGRYADSDDIIPQPEHAEDTNELVTIDTDESFKNVRNMDKASISWSGMSGYYK
jgi:hypothetical protein